MTAPAASSASLPDDAALASAVAAVRRLDAAARDAVAALSKVDGRQVVVEEGMDLGAALRLHTRAAPWDVTSLVGAAEALARRPVLEALFATGVLSWGHVRQLLAATRRYGPDQVAALEGHLDRHRETLAAVDGDRLAGMLDDAATQCERPATVEAREQREQDGNRFVLMPQLDGTSTSYGTWDREATALLADRLQHEADAPQAPACPGDVDAPVREPEAPRGRQLAEALLRLVDRAGCGDNGGVTSAPTRFTVLVDLDRVIDQAAGRIQTALRGARSTVTGLALERLACDPAIDVVVRDGTDLLAAQRYAPDVTAAVRRAVEGRDRGCRFPACTAPVAWCDVHHVTPRAETALQGVPQGDHSLSNLVLLCRRHHTVIHRRGWRQTLDADGRWTITRHGRTWTTLPRTATDLPPPERPVRNRRRGARSRPPDEPPDGHDPPGPRGTDAPDTGPTAATGTDPPGADPPEVDASDDTPGPPDPLPF